MAERMTSRTEILLGEEGISRLAGARVVLAGAGAVGGYALEGMVRAGIGHIKVVDADVFSESNMNRQVLATVNTVGRPKAEVACERARSINPGIDIVGMPAMVSEETVPSILEGCDVLVDAIDTVRHKTALVRGAVEAGIPVYSSMGAALHADPRMVRIATLRKTSVCPIAASLRRSLRDLDTSNVTCVYSEEPPVAVPTERDGHGKSVLGSLPTIPAIFGMTLANEVILGIASGRIGRRLRHRTPGWSLDSIFIVGIYIQLQKPVPQDLFRAAMLSAPGERIRPNGPAEGASGSAFRTVS